MREEKVQKFMRIAEAISRLSSCHSRKVGCILVDTKGYILSTGYNGPPHNMGECSCCNRVSGENLDLCPAVHAEMNALMQCYDIQEIDYCFVTTKPCRHCIKMLLNTSCKKIFYVEDYPHSGVKELWESAGRYMVQVRYT
jgi:dCMP deaminase